MARGRYMKASQLHETVRQLLAGGHTKDTPVWFDVLHSIPAAETMVRTRPVQLQEAPSKRLMPKNTFRPQNLVYEEDALRKRFFQDHPWELARPKVISERHGTESRHLDWSKGLRQPGVALCGESVVQRQMWLMHNYVPDQEPTAERSESYIESQAESLVEPVLEAAPVGLGLNAAYDMARREFYELREREEIEVRVQREESRMVGGYFGPTMLHMGEKLEDKAYAEWMRWARKNVAEIKADRLARSASNVVVEEEEEEEEIVPIPSEQDPKEEKAASPLVDIPSRAIKI